MRRLVWVLALGLAGPAAAQGLVGRALCEAVWADLSGRMSAVSPVTGTVVGEAEGPCRIADVRVDLPGKYVPDWHAAEVTLSGPVLPWLLGEPASPERLELRVEGLHHVITTGTPQMDYLFAAQARSRPIRAEVVLVWDPAQKRLGVERLDIDFPGENRVQVTASLDGVDLSSSAALQMSAMGWALRRADVTVQSHGLFEAYALMALGESLLPPEGDMAAAVARLKADAGQAVRALPSGSFDDASKAALLALIDEMPNPSGQLTVSVDVASGFGPARFLGYTDTGLPDTLDGTAVLLDGVTVAVGWTHEATR